MPHTPGPWTACKRHFWIVYSDVGDVRIAECGVPDSRVAEANARLIAAAPDMLAACRACSDLITAWINGPFFKGAGIAFGEDSPPALHAARNAIAKAEDTGKDWSAEDIMRREG